MHRSMTAYKSAYHFVLFCFVFGLMISIVFVAQLRMCCIGSLCGLFRDMTNVDLCDLTM